jgi:polyisoprenoid-binding protein YceI
MPEGNSATNMKNYLLFLLATWPLCKAHFAGQTQYELSKGYAVSIHGTMSIHNWVETIGVVTGDLVVGSHDGAGTDLSSIRITMEARSIKGDMGKVMDNKTYKALKADANPEIIFRLGSPVTLMPVQGKEKPVALKGLLTLAGVTRLATLWVNYFSIERDSMRFEGEQTIQMTDFGIKPPSALFGTLKAGPEITIFFKTVFTIKQK